MQKPTQPAVSVITPVYNGEKYLAQCIESVLAQTYDNWNYVIVNNCSSDGSAEIARRYAERDRRICIHENQRFLPVVANHNAALRLISPESKYCKMVFADDWLFPECLEQMVALAESHPSVGVVNAYSLRDEIVMWTGLPYPSTVVPGHEACRRRLKNEPYVFGTGTSHMLRADLVRGRECFYNEANLHCDSESCFQILQSSDFGFIHQVLSYTRAPRADSMTMLAYQLHTLEAMTLYELITYGPIYLTPEEFRGCMKEKLTQYYDLLAQSLLRGGDFWKFHKGKLSEFGVKLDRSRLAKALLKKGISALVKHPWQTIKQLWDGTSVISGRTQTMAASARIPAEGHQERG